MEVKLRRHPIMLLRIDFVATKREHRDEQRASLTEKTKIDFLTKHHDVAVREENENRVVHAWSYFLRRFSKEHSCVWLSPQSLDQVCVGHSSRRAVMPTQCSSGPLP